MTVPPVANGGAAAGMVLGAVFALVVHTSAADAVVSLLIGVGGTLGFGKVPPTPRLTPSPRPPRHQGAEVLKRFCGTRCCGATSRCSSELAVVSGLLAWCSDWQSSR